MNKLKRGDKVYIRECHSNQAWYDNQRRVITRIKVIDGIFIAILSPALKDLYGNEINTYSLRKAEVLDIDFEKFYDGFEGQG